MGLFSGILGAVGSVFGPVGTAVGGALGGAFDKKQDQKAQQKAINAQNEASRVATEASIEQTNAWRQENRGWDLDDAARDREYSTRMFYEANQWQENMLKREKEYNDPSALRARAEAAGFNPLALLGTGVGVSAASPQSASAPYGGTQNSVGVSIAPAADIAASPIASSDLSLLGEAFGSGMQEYSTAVSETTQLRQHNQALKQELAKAVIRPSIGGVYGGGDVPVQMIAANKYGSTSNPSKPRAVDKDAEAASEKGYATGSKSGTLFGMQLETSGLFSDGAWFTDKYGEPAEWAVAVPSLASDIGHTIGKNARRGVDAWIKSKKDAYSAIDWKKYGEEADQLYKRKPPTEFDHYQNMRLKYSR